MPPHCQPPHPLLLRPPPPGALAMEGRGPDGPEPRRPDPLRGPAPRPPPARARRANPAQHAAPLPSSRPHDRERRGQAAPRGAEEALNGTVVRTRWPRARSGACATAGAAPAGTTTPPGRARDSPCKDPSPSRGAGRQNHKQRSARKTEKGARGMTPAPAPFTTTPRPPHPPPPRTHSPDFRTSGATPIVCASRTDYAAQPNTP